MRGFEAIEKSQRKLYRQIKQELPLFEITKDKTVATYERAFRRSLPRRGKPSSKSKLLKAISKASVILVGDFHPFRQSQKSFLRIVREFNFSKKKGFIALECVQIHHQEFLDEYLNDLISLEELRDKINFERYWPFSWESYKEIILQAKKDSLGLIALNIPEKSRNSKVLRARDMAAAKTIAEVLKENPEAVVFALYGELHLAPIHLPKDIKGLIRQKKIVTVHQNNSQLYWSTPRLNSGERPEVLQLSPTEFCILNSVPWVKIQSYLNWLEGNPDTDEASDDIDIAGSVFHFAKLIGDTIGLKSPLSENIEICYLNPDDPDTVPIVLSRINRAERTLLNHSTRLNRTTYLPSSKLIILRSVSTNALAEAASFLLWHSNRKKTYSPQSSFNFIVHFFIGYIGSKMFNPKRKCNELKDLRSILHLRRTPKGFESSKRLVIKEALEIGELLFEKRTPPANRKRISSPLQIEANRLIGYVVANRLFSALLKDEELLPLIRTWFSASTEQESLDLLKKTLRKINISKTIELGKKDRL